MESFGHERQVQQGEDWNLDILLSASDKEYIPYIISSERNNPYFVVTVASTKYEKNLRYVKSFWNDIDSINPITNAPFIPRFFSTVPVECGELGYVDPNADDKVLKDLPIMPGLGEFAEATNGDSINRRYLYQYTKASDEIDPELGHKEYHYFYFDYSTGVATRVDGYECHVIYNFPSEVTAEWTGQNYLYQITLVSGLTLADRLEQIYRVKLQEGKITEKDWPDTIEGQYKYVKLVWPNELQPDIDVDSPLGRILQPEPILPPTKLEVFNNLRTII